MMLKQFKILGMVIVLVLMFTSVANAASPPQQEREGQEYVVQADDWLSDLAEKYLGDANQWNRIVEATNARAAEDPRLAPIENPDLIYPGQIVFIPSGSSTSPVGTEPDVEMANLGAFCGDQHPAAQAFCAEIPIAQVQFDPHEEAEFFTCASRSGLENVQIDPTNEVTILVPNDGDFDLNGVVAAVKVTEEGAVLIPRWPESKFDFSTELAEAYDLPAGEQLELPLAKAFELIKAGELIWTGEHGEAGKAGLFQTNPPLRCDPQADFEIEIGPFNPTG